jgi:hypothetical protein
MGILPVLWSPQTALMGVNRGIASADAWATTSLWRRHEAMLRFEGMAPPASGVERVQLKTDLSMWQGRKWQLSLTRKPDP